MNEPIQSAADLVRQTAATVAGWDGLHKSFDVPDEVAEYSPDLADRIDAASVAFSSTAKRASEDAAAALNLEAAAIIGSLAGWTTVPEARAPGASVALRGAPQDQASTPPGGGDDDGGVVPPGGGDDDGGVVPSSQPAGSEGEFDGGMTEAEANAAGPKRRDHADTVASWMAIGEALRQEPDLRVRVTVAQWLGLRVDGDGSIPLGESGPSEFTNGHMVERHEGQVTLAMLVARLLWKRDPAGLKQPKKEGVRLTATAFSSPDAMLAPLLAFAREMWTLNGVAGNTATEILESLATGKPGQRSAEVTLDLSRCGLGPDGVLAVSGVRAEWNGEDIDFEETRDERVDDPVMYQDARFVCRHLSVEELANKGSCVLRFREKHGVWRLITGYPDPEKKKQVT